MNTLNTSPGPVMLPDDTPNTRHDDPGAMLSSTAAPPPVPPAGLAEEAALTGIGPARRLSEQLAAAARIVAPAIAALVGLAVIVNAGLAVMRLFARVGLDTPTQALAAVASVGVLVALVGVLELARNPAVRGLALLYVMAWAPLVLLIVGLEAALASDLFSVPLALLQAGRVAAALLAALALLPAITLSVASRRQEARTVREAIAHYTGNVLKLVLLVATSAANLAFGLARGVPLEVSIFVAVVLETAFVLALLRAPDQSLHAGALVIFGAAIALVAVETISALTRLATLPGLAQIGEALYLLAPALAISYIVLTALVERRGRASTRPAASRVLRRVAGEVQIVREDLAALRGAWRQTGDRLPASAQNTELTGDVLPNPAAAGMNGSARMASPGDGTPPKSPGDAS